MRNDTVSAKLLAHALSNPTLEAKKIRQSFKSKNTAMLFKQLAHSLRITLREDTFPCEINAVCFKHQHRYYLGINTHIKSQGEKNFIIAHEIGHIALHPKTISINLKEEHHLDNIRISAMDAQANAFAMELLMPEKVFRRDAAHLNVSEMAKLFDLHEAVVAYRKKALNA